MDLSPGVEIEGIEVTSTQIPGFLKNPGISALNRMAKDPLGQPRNLVAIGGDRPRPALG
jgi:hypothetical protein